MKKIFCFIFLFIFIGSVDAQPINPNFDDDNFYDCVIMNLNEDEINGINDRDSKTYVATDEELANMPTLACVSYNINSVKGLEKLTGITYVDFEDNNIKELDLTSNPKVVYLYTDDGVNVTGYDGNIEIPSQRLVEKKSTKNYFIVGLIGIVIIVLISIIVKKLKKKKTTKLNNNNFDDNTKTTNFDQNFNNNQTFKICPHCGARLKDDAKVCFICGKEI